MRVMPYNHRIRKLLLGSLTAVLLLNLILPAHVLAWKPTTHVYLADIALQDALDDGHITINRVDYKQGQIIGEVGDYAVDPKILSALQNSAPQYRAGILGPDAYPDILTGQLIIHPHANETGVEGGPDAWLKHLWAQSNTPPYDTDPINAFTVGFLTHAAGDMYAHTFVNYFTGAPFTIYPPAGPENAIKHNLLEGYIDKRLDADAFGADFFVTNLADVEDDNTDFIYRTMIDARPGTNLGDKLLPEESENALYSIPRIFSTLQANLREDLAEDYNNDCEFWELECRYKDHWSDDIDRGLRKWPQVSHEIAIALFFNPDHEMKVGEARDIAANYAEDELLSMAGTPDALVDFVKIINDITPDFLLEPIEDLINEHLEKLIEEALGITIEKLREYVTNPEVWFDLFMTHGSGVKVSLQRFNTEYLKLTDTGYNNPDESFDYRQVPAAYNTVTMSKLVLLSQGEVNRLLDDLGSEVRLDEPNIMLGFAQTLDGENQWLDGMVLAQDCDAYEQVFMLQPGEMPCPRFRSFLPMTMGLTNIPMCFERAATIIGTANDDILTGTAGNDVIVGLAGNDIIDGGEGDDIICGFEGDDTIRGNLGNDIINGNTGKDMIEGGDGDDYLRGGQDQDTIYGLDGNDEIYGDLGNDDINGNVGNDKIEGGEGHDILHGGKDNDDIKGNDGDDEIYGGFGDDTINGNVGNDVIDGREGNDVLRGGQNNDTIKGNDGDDEIYGGFGDDNLDGSSGTNQIDGGEGSDTCLNGPSMVNCES